MSNREKNLRRLYELVAILHGKRRMLIVLQDYPDPDAIAAAAALRELANAISHVDCSIAHGGVVGRAENQAMVKYVGLSLRPITEVDPAKFDLIAMVDTQPGTGNNSLPSHVVPDVVIDHHPVRRLTRRAPFMDIRGKYGATSTILYEYLREAGLTPSAPLSTALFYGIWSDTQDLGRKCIQADVDAFLDLHAMANKRQLKQIRHGKVPQAYFQILADALRNASVHGHALVTGLGAISNPDMVGEVADLLLRNEPTSWVLCYGFYGRKALFSLRTSRATANAGRVARRMVAGRGAGGGHHGAAGGQIVLKGDSPAERKHAEAAIVRRFLALTRQDRSRGCRLVEANGVVDDGTPPAR